ncbi:BZ3501_MvSof-1269-A2-R1_Chr3-2g05825 [Microbotryum saponariae]|nr:BZ3501_MvSof-1269-A2-R1_Chr3-2g05825 [Microbotryum saponariae]
MSGSPAATSAADARALANNAVTSELKTDPASTAAGKESSTSPETNSAVDANQSSANSEEDAPFEPDTDPIPAPTTAGAAIHSGSATKGVETESNERGTSVTTPAPTHSVPGASASTSTFAPPAPAPVQASPSPSTSNVSESIAGSRPRRVSVLSTQPDTSDQRSVVKWTPADDRKLDEAFAKYGPSWDAVAAAVGNGRTNRSCKERLGRRQRSNDPTVSMAPLTVVPRRASIDAGEGDSPGHEHVFNRRPSPFADAEGEDDSMVVDAPAPPAPAPAPAPVVAKPAPIAAPVASDTPPKIIGKKLGKSRPSAAKLVPTAAPSAATTSAATAAPVPAAAAAVEVPSTSTAPPPAVDNPLVYSAATADRTMVAGGVSATTARILSAVDDRLREAGIGGRIPGRAVTAPANGDVKPEVTSEDTSSSPSTSTPTLAPSAGHNIALTTPFNKNTVIRGRRTMAANEMEGKLLSKTGKIKKVHICPADSCDAAFKRSEHLKRHYKAVHIGAKPFPCDAEGCDKTFSRKDNLHQHMIFVHSLKPIREDGIQFLDELMPPAAPVPAAIPEVAVAASPDAPVDATSGTLGPSVLAPTASTSAAPTTPAAVEGSQSPAAVPAALSNTGQFASSRGRVPVPIRYEPIAEEDKNRRRKIVRKISPGGTFTEEHLNSPGPGAAASPSPLAADAKPKTEPVEQSLSMKAASPAPQAAKEASVAAVPPPVSPVAPEVASTSSSTPPVLPSASTSTPLDEEATTNLTRTPSTSSRAKLARGGGLGARFRQGRGGSIAAAASAIAAAGAASSPTTTKRPAQVPVHPTPVIEVTNGHAARPRENVVEEPSNEGGALGFAPPRKHAREESGNDDEASAAKRAREIELDSGNVSA